MTKRGYALIVGLLGGLLMTSAACHRSSDASLDVTLGALTNVSVPPTSGTSPTIAWLPQGHRIVAWVTVPQDGGGPVLSVRVDSASPVTLRDPIGAAQAHAEAPPQVAVSPDGNTIGVLYVLGKDVGKRFPASALRFVRSNDGGHTWSVPVTVTDAGPDFGSHSFHALTIASDRVMYASWLDGRSGSMTTTVARSIDGGQTWLSNTPIAVGETCPCCRSALAADTNGVVYAAWRAVFPGDVRDMVVARSVDHGVTWSTPSRVHVDGWVFPGCPHAGPSLRVDDRGRVHIVWWTGKPDAAGVWYAYSDDGARTFSHPVALDSQSIPLPTHVNLAVTSARHVLAVWDDASVTPSRIVLRASLDSGHTFGAPIVLSDTTRDAHHPVITFAPVANEDAAMITWTESANAMGHAMGHMTDRKAPAEPASMSQVRHHGVMGHGTMEMPPVAIPGLTRVVVRTLRMASTRVSSPPA